MGFIYFYSIYNNHYFTINFIVAVNLNYIINLMDNIKIEKDHKHNFVSFPDSSPIYCTICGTQLNNITKDITKDNSSIKNYQNNHKSLASLLPLVQNIRHLNASSIYNEEHNVENSLLNSIPKQGFSGAWCGKTNDENQWIMLDCGKNYKIHGVAIQGRYYKDEYPQWVSEFKLYGRKDKENQEIYIGTFG